MPKQHQAKGVFSVQYSVLGVRITPDWYRRGSCERELPGVSTIAGAVPLEFAFAIMTISHLAYRRIPVAWTATPLPICANSCKRNEASVPEWMSDPRQSWFLRIRRTKFKARQ